MATTRKIDWVEQMKQFLNPDQATMEYYQREFIRMNKEDKKEQETEE